MKKITPPLNWRLTTVFDLIEQLDEKKSKKIQFECNGGEWRLEKIKKKKPNKQLTTKKAIQKAQLVELWRETRGHVSNMCRTVEITRKTFYEWLKKDKEFNKAIIEAEYELHDDVRDALIQKIADGSSSDIQFYLKKRHPDFMDKRVPTVAVQVNTIIAEKKDKYGI